MLKSMTAYGRGMFELEGAQFTVEIQSVNRRHLEVQAFVPDFLSAYETAVRGAVSRQISRGQVTVKARVSFHGKTPLIVTPNIPLAKELKQAWDTISQQLDVKGFELSFLAQVPEVMSCEMGDSENEKLHIALLECLELALSDLSLAKLKEGSLLVEEFLGRLELLRYHLDQIEKMSHEAPAKMRKKLLERIQEVVSNACEDDRITREVALLADKLDITEECVRFKYHLSHISELIVKGGSCGKALEFILQELSREINTIGSKCQDAEVARLVINAKGEIEKIREQVQNVE